MHLSVTFGSWTFSSAAPCLQRGAAATLACSEARYGKETYLGGCVDAFVCLWLGLGTWEGNVATAGKVVKVFFGSINFGVSPTDGYTNSPHVATHPKFRFANALGTAIVLKRFLEPGSYKYNHRILIASVAFLKQLIAYVHSCSGRQPAYVLTVLCQRNSSISDKNKGKNSTVIFWGNKLHQIAQSSGPSDDTVQFPLCLWGTAAENMSRSLRHCCFLESFCLRLFGSFKWMQHTQVVGIAKFRVSLPLALTLFRAAEASWINTPQPQWCFSQLQSIQHQSPGNTMKCCHILSHEFEKHSKQSFLKTPTSFALRSMSMPNKTLNGLGTIWYHLGLRAYLCGKRPAASRTGVPEDSIAPTSGDFWCMTCYYAKPGDSRQRKPWR